MQGEASLLQWMTEDKKLAASSAAVNAYLAHTIPLLGQFSLADIARIRKEERDSFARYRQAVDRIVNEILRKKKEISREDGRQIYRDWIEPQLRAIREEAQGIMRSQRRRVAGGLAGLGAAVVLGAFGTALPPPLHTTLVTAAGAVGGTLLSKAAETACDHRFSAGKNDFYFLLKLAEQTSVH